MKNIKKVVVLFSIIIFCNCSSSEPCMKTITIPGVRIVTPSGSSTGPDTILEVPCDYEIPPIKEPEPVQNVSYEVLLFNFTPNTGNNTSRLKFDIKIKNQNNFSIKGYAYFTTNADGVIVSQLFLNGATSNCNTINANSSCVFSYDKESPLNLNLGFVQSIQLVNVQFFLNN